MQLCYVKKDLDCLGKCVLILLMSTENKVKFNQKPVRKYLYMWSQLYWENNYLSMCTVKKVIQEDWKKMYPEVPYILMEWLSCMWFYYISKFAVTACITFIIKQRFITKRTGQHSFDSTELCMVLKLSRSLEWLRPLETFIPFHRSKKKGKNMKCGWDNTVGLRIEPWTEAPNNINLENLY